MSRPPARARARIALLPLAGILGAFALSGAAIALEGTSGADPFSQQGAEMGAQYALLSGRVSAPAGAQWDFAVPEIRTAVVATVRVSRPVANRPVPAAVAGNAILEEAAKYVGVPYLWSGTTPAGFDCTGFVAYVYGQFGISLPRSSSAYWGVGTRVSAADARPGDLIVSSGHVGIYAGGNMQIDSPRPGLTIQFREIWQTSYIFVRVG